jgi:hypothetical protein
MGAGAVSRSMTRGVESFAIDLQPEFLEVVSRRPADPEAVATFVQQNALKAKTALSTEDAASFSESAVDTWLRETWPAVQQAYGVAARVFFTLARFVEAGLRPGSGFPLSMGPRWAYHEQWGPEFWPIAAPHRQIRRTAKRGTTSGPGSVRRPTRREIRSRPTRSETKQSPPIAAPHRQIRRTAKRGTASESNSVRKPTGRAIQARPLRSETRRSQPIAAPHRQTRKTAKCGMVCVPLC